MTTLTSLSNEVIDVILQQENVSIQDVVNFGLTCTRFLAVIDDNLLWQKKFYQRWPYLKKIYDKQIQNKENVNFKDNVKASIQCRNKLRSYLSLMSELFFRKYETIDVDILHSYVPFFSSEGTHTMNYYFLMDELLYLIEMYPRLPNCNLTLKFYSEKLFPFVHQYHLKDLWQKFMNYPQEQQFLEQAAIIVAQWYQPQKRIFYFDVEASLDNIAQQVLEGLKNVHCDHPIFSISAEQFSFWKYNNINNKQWNRKDERQILDVLRTVFFDELGFHGVSDVNIIYPKAEYILIDCVLETKVGNAISLAIIFQSVARRLGVRCDIVYLPHILLSWKPNRDTGSLGDEYFYIDILHGGYMLSKNDCPITRGRRCPIETCKLHSEVAPVEMALHIINFLETVKPQHYQDRTLQMRSLKELRYIIEPHNIDVIENLGCYYVYSNINLSGLITTLQKLLNNYNDETSVEANRIAKILRRCESYKQDLMIEFNPCETPKIRSNQMKYAVGMIVDYNSHVENYTGVIIWWDEKYNVDIRRDTFKISFGYIQFSELPYSSISEFERNEKQPFYIVLSENGDKYYVAQDALVKTYPPKWIKHNEIGRYFCRFAESHYVPNDALTKYFPHDIDFLNTL